MPLSSHKVFTEALLTEPAICLKKNLEEKNQQNENLILKPSGMRMGLKSCSI